MDQMVAMPRNVKRGRRPSIAPDDGVRRLSCMVASPVLADLEAEAKRRRVSVARVVRDRLARSSDGVHA